MQSRSFWRYENGVLALLGTTFGLVFYDRVAITFLFPFITAELHLSNTQLGLISSALALAWAASGYLLGAYSDRSDNKKSILLLSVVGFSACTALSGAAVSFGMLLLIRVLMGIFEGPVLPIAQSVMAAESTPERRGFNMGILQNGAGSVLALIAGPPITAALATEFGWRNALYIVAVPGFVMAALLWIFLKSRRAAPAGAAVRAAPAAPAVRIRDLLRYRNVWLGALIACCLVTWLLVLLTFTPMYLMQTRGLSASEMGLVMAAIGCASLIWGFCVPLASDRWGRKPAVALFSALSAAAPLVLMLLDAPVGTLAVAAFAGFLATGCFPLVMATIPSETVPPSSVATTLGLIMGVSEIIGGVLAPTLAGMGADVFGSPFPLYVSACAALLAGVLSLFLFETAPRRVNAMRQAAPTAA